MFSAPKVKKPCAKPFGIKTDLQFLSVRRMEYALPNVFDFFLIVFTRFLEVPSINLKGILYF